MIFRHGGEGARTPSLPQRMEIGDLVPDTRREVSGDGFDGFVGEAGELFGAGEIIAHENVKEPLHADCTESTF